MPGVRPFSCTALWSLVQTLLLLCVVSNEAGKDRIFPLASLLHVLDTKGSITGTEAICNQTFNVPVLHAYFNSLANAGFLDQKIPILVFCCSLTLLQKLAIPCPYSLSCAALLISAARKVPQLRAQTIAAVKAAFFEGPFLPFSFYGPVSRCASSTSTTQHCMQKNMARSSWQLKWTIWWHASSY